MGQLVYLPTATRPPLRLVPTAEDAPHFTDRLIIAPTAPLPPPVELTPAQQLEYSFMNLSARAGSEDAARIWQNKADQVALSITSIPPQPSDHIGPQLLPNGYDPRPDTSWPLGVKIVVVTSVALAVWSLIFFGLSLAFPQVQP